MTGPWPVRFIPVTGCHVLCLGKRRMQWIRTGREKHKEEKKKKEKVTGMGNELRREEKKKASVVEKREKRRNREGKKLDEER
jgi:hypothetical protein